MEKKLAINNPTTWNHHRYGWKYIVQLMQENLGESNGIHTVCWLDGVLGSNRPILIPWTGILHNSITHPKKAGSQYSRFHSMESLVKSSAWKASQPFCKGIFTLCEHTRDFLRNHTKASVDSVVHPVGGDYLQWKPSEKIKLIQVGHWLRDFSAMHKLKNIDRTILKCGGNRAQLSNMKIMKKLSYYDPDVLIMDSVSDAEFDKLLSSYVVFLRLFDVAACNTILDCILRSTPLIVNRLPAAEEYLGVDYPLFYDDLNEIYDLIKKDKINEGHLYLHNMNKKKFTTESFLNQITTTDVYQNLQIIPWHL